MSGLPLRYPLHVQISFLFISLILLISATLAALGFRLGQDLLEANAKDASERIAGEVVRDIQGLLVPGELATNLLRHSPLASAQSHADRMARLASMREALLDSEALSSIYFGYPDGDFFFLRRLRDQADAYSFAAPQDAHFLVQSIDRTVAGASGVFVFLDEDLEVLREDVRSEYPDEYDPRERAWYQAAIAAYGQIKTAPYVFFSNRKMGTTIAVEAPQEGVVVGADILLSTLAETLARNKVTPGTELLVVDSAGRLFAYEQLDRMLRSRSSDMPWTELPLLAEVSKPLFQYLDGVLFSSQGDGVPSAVELEGHVWRVVTERLEIEGAPPMRLVVAIPEAELLADANHMMWTATVLTVLVIVLALPASWWLARSVSRPLRALAGVAERIRNFDFDQPLEIRSMVTEVVELAATLEAMKRTIRRFLDVSIAVASESDFDRLLRRLLEETAEAAGARAAMLYLADDDGFELGAELLPDDLPRVVEVRLNVAGLSPVLAAALSEDHSQSLALDLDDFASLGFTASQIETLPSRLVVVPLRNRRQERVGAMLLLLDEDVDAARLSFIDAVCGSSVVSLENKALIQAQKALFEAFIKLIAGAIDAKSPYTGGHCARVPELTKMLAQAACEDEQGSLRGFELSDEEWEAVHVAAWLHDCGKVTTPEYVVDKATKLETLYDRIHEIRMRFEVLKCEAEIEALQAQLDGVPADQARQQLARRLAELDQEFTFVAQCNVGGEWLSPEAVERLRRIAQRRWRRTLDDRLGVSHEELTRKQRTPAPELPVREPLLADRPEHVFERGPQDRIGEDASLGFNMKVPALLYNRGELYNLSIARGTLNEEERYKINEHIVQTLVMLSQLPFPRHLRAVPELAGGHHEKMDGSGYPRGLTREQMSPVARMMAIADVFEALTAADRPYKTGKTLSESLRIMARMCDEHHLDPELFGLFVRSGVYLDYAQRYLRPEQIDAIESAEILREGAGDRVTG